MITRARAPHLPSTPLTPPGHPQVYKLAEHPSAPVLCRGRAVGFRVGSGAARVIMNASNMHDLQPGEVLFSEPPPLLFQWSAYHRFPASTLPGTLTDMEMVRQPI